MLAVLSLTIQTNGQTPPSQPATRATTAPASRPSKSLIEALMPLSPAATAFDLIAAGADVNERGWDGRSSALYYAVRRRDALPIVQLMVEKGADVKARCIGGCTPLHNACQFGSAEVVEYLISKGADVNAKDDFGYTPMHWVVMGGWRLDRPPIIRTLVQHGADINAVSDRGETPLRMSELEIRRPDNVLRGLGAK